MREPFSFSRVSARRIQRSFPLQTDFELCSLLSAPFLLSNCHFVTAW